MYLTAREMFLFNFCNKEDFWLDLSASARTPEDHAKAKELCIWKVYDYIDYDYHYASSYPSIIYNSSIPRELGYNFKRKKIALRSELGRKNGAAMQFGARGFSTYFRLNGTDTIEVVFYKKTNNYNYEILFDIKNKRYKRHKWNVERRGWEYWDDIESPVLSAINNFCYAWGIN